MIVDNETNKQLNDFIAKRREKSKLNTCLYCGKETTSFCASHTVPKFCLHNISDSGKVLTLKTILMPTSTNSSDGIKRAGVFRRICRECDSKIFSDYENPNNYHDSPTQKMMAEIALKNYLRLVSKRLDETCGYDMLLQEEKIPRNIGKYRQIINSDDLTYYQECFEKAKQSIITDLQNKYYLCYYKKISYVVPLAFQGAVTLPVDLNGNVINDIYSLSSKTSEIQICVFPLKEESVILMFINDDDKRYRNFYRKIKKFNPEEQLAVINYIIFLTSEDVFLSETLQDIVQNNHELLSVMQIFTEIGIKFPENTHRYDLYRKKFTLERKDKIPNFLSEKYKIR